MRTDKALAPLGLRVTGQFIPEAADEEAAFSMITLIGADGDRMWEVFSQSREAQDGDANPMDRWSARVLGKVATDLGATALFPFGGPPWQPFLRWAGLGEGARSSPVAMQVSPTRGLWMSYRGALGFSEVIDLPEIEKTDPCIGCPAPCTQACPVDAFALGTYNVPACTEHLNSTDGTSCLSGCKVRLACPVGDAPPLAQRQFHMKAFLDARNAANQASSD